MARDGEQGPGRCVICGAGAPDDAPCPRCGAERVQRPAADADHDDAGPLVLLGARIAADEPAGAADGEGLQPAFAVEVAGGTTLEVLTPAGTLMLHPPELDPTDLLVPGAEVLVLGSTATRFGDEPAEPDYRRPARPRRQLRARAVIVGPDRQAQLEHALRQLGRGVPTLNELFRGQDVPRGVRLKLLQGPTGPRLRLVVRMARPWAPFGGLALIVGFGLMLATILLHDRYGPDGFAVVRQWAPWALAVPLVGLLLALLARTVVLLDAATVTIRRGVLHARRVFSAPTARVRQVFQSSGKTRDLVWLELTDGRRQLVLGDRDERTAFLRTCLVSALRTMGQPVVDAGDLERPDDRPLWRRLLPVLALAGLGLGGFAVVFRTPACLLACNGPLVHHALERAGRCPRVTRELGPNLTWAVGESHDETRHDGGSLHLQVKGDRGRGRLELRFSGSRQAPELSALRVWAGGQAIDVLRCRR